jgi:hypothetical protein
MSKNDIYGSCGLIARSKSDLFYPNLDRSVEIIRILASEIEKLKAENKQKK